MNYPFEYDKFIKKIFLYLSEIFYSFIPIHFVIGIRSTNLFHFITFLKFEFHE